MIKKTEAIARWRGGARGRGEVEEEEERMEGSRMAPVEGCSDGGRGGFGVFYLH